MSIYLSQHGKSASKGVDPQRGLTMEGRTEVTRVAEALQRAGISVDAIWHSGKARAAQTAEIFAAALVPAGGVRSREGIDPLDDVAAFAGSLVKEGEAMYVGHLPFMERIVAYLITADADRPVIRFQNGGVVCLDWDAEVERWVIRWTAFPNLQAG